MSEQVTTTTALEAVLAMDAYYHRPDTGDWSLALTTIFPNLLKGALGIGTVVA
jgi:hypothetical protein